MNAERPIRAFRQLLAAASDEPPAPGPHVVDDDELLDRWSGGELDPAEHEKLLDHLDQCSYCRSAAARMLREGVLPLESLTASPSATAPPAVVPVAEGGAAAGKSAGGGVTGNARQWWSLAAAAGLIGIAFLLFATGRPDNQVALAEKELNANRPDAALARLEAAARQGIPADDEIRAKSLAERAGYALSEQALTSAAFDSAREVVQRARQVGADSARLTNIELQAVRGVPGDSALARQDKLLDYQYDLNGRAFGKSLPVLDAATSRLLEDFAGAVGRFPSDLLLRLNYGQLLLSLARWPEAREQFDAAREIDQGSTQARLGLGLVAFEQGNIEEAAAEFVGAAEQAPENFAAHLNAAICLDRLQRPDEAARYWERAEALATDPALKQQITAHRRGG